MAISVTGETKTVDNEKAISALTQHVKKVKLVVQNPKREDNKWWGFLTFVVIIILSLITNNWNELGQTFIYLLLNTCSFLLFSQERLIECIKMLNDLSLIGGSIKSVIASVQASSVPQSPIGVLDAACLSYKSDDTTVGSCANSAQNTPEPDTKRRKLNRPYEMEP